MAAYAIQARGLSKSYRIATGSTRYQYKTLRESLAEAVRRPFRSEDDRVETFWALQDVSFDVDRGEALGIIGRNGAGKSTLLKLLSRITRPTRGSADIYGSMGSLLEVGTGFHPELTGRENVFLNGAILGMSRSEIRRRFDEIVAFAEIDKFLDTPVKRYSSGMYTRLAFAVAAHLEPEILIVDEVLAVGDSEFQKKCLGKMRDVAGAGRTVLFVSHNMAAIAQLCSRTLLLQTGRVLADGRPDEVIARYLSGRNQEGRAELGSRPRPQGSGGVFFEWAEVRSFDDELCQDFSIGEGVRIALGLRLAASRPRARFLVSIVADDGTPVALISSEDAAFSLGNDRDRWTVLVDFDDIRLYPGTYRVTMWASDSQDAEEFDRVDDCLLFRIVDGGRLTMRNLPRHAGLIFLTPTWRSLPDDVASTSSPPTRR